MIHECTDHKGGVLLTLSYDAGKLWQRACERTQAVAATMQDGGGNSLYEAMSATEDNSWMLSRYADGAWHDVIEMCTAYLHCPLTTADDSDEMQKEYVISLMLPKRWNGACAITLNGAIEEYVISSIVRMWWITKGNADHAGVEDGTMQQCRSKIKYALNCRMPGPGGRGVRYF